MLKNIKTKLFILIFIISNNGFAAEEKYKFSKKLQDNYIDAMYEAMIDIESHSRPATYKKAVMALCPELEVFLKGSTKPTEDLAPIESELCEVAAHSKGIKCIGGGLSGPAAARAIMRGKIQKFCTKIFISK